MTLKAVVSQQDLQVLGVANCLLLLSNTLSAPKAAGLPWVDLAWRGREMIRLLGSGQTL